MKRIKSWITCLQVLLVFSSCIFSLHLMKSQSCSNSKQVKQFYLSFGNQLTNQKVLSKNSEWVRRNLRILQQNSDKNQNNSGGSEERKYIFGWNKAQFTFALTIFIIVGVLVTISCCTVCLTCLVLKNLGNKNKILPKDDINFNALMPQITYSLFIQQVGKPLQQQCAICLEDFAPQKQNDQNSKQATKSSLNQRQITQNIVQYREVIQNASQIDKNQQNNQHSGVEFEKDCVRLTFCGHLLHSNCLNQWLKKQHNCPICRQSFTFQNIELWQQKTLLKFKDTKNKKINQDKNCNDLMKDKHKKQSQPQMQSMIPQKETKINWSIGAIDSQQQISQQNLNNICFNSNQNIKYSIKIYKRIMAYHRKEFQFKKVQKVNEVEPESEISLQQSQISEGSKRVLNSQRIKPKKVSKLQNMR